MSNMGTFTRRNYNELASCMSEVLIDTKPEHLPVACSILLRVTNALAMRNANMQMRRFMDAAGIPGSTNAKDTRRS